MTFTFIIMDSLYIMRNLLMIFFLMVVFWTNLGNCEGELTTEISTIPNDTTTTPPGELPTEISTITNDTTTTPPADDFCGTDNITLLEGTLHNLTNPFYPYFNIGNRDCIWFISGPLGYNIVIKFYELAINPYIHTLSVGYGNDPDNTTSRIAKLYDEPQSVIIMSENGWIRFEMSHEEYDISFSAVLLTADVSNVSFPCHSNSLICEGICLPESWICDNVRDCLLGQDEYNCDASSCDEPAPPDDLVFHSPDFAEGEMYAHGTEIMYDCPDGLDLNGHMTAVCLYGVWTHEDANCTASSCDEPAPPDDFVFHSPDFAEGEMYANGTEIMYDCPDGLNLNGHMTAVCLYGNWTYEDAYCTGTDVCDKYTQCFYDEARMHSTVSCNYKTAGNTAHPCYGDGSIITCSCKSDKFQLSSTDNSYLCRPDKWEDGLYDLHCLTASPCDEPAPPDDLVFHRPDFAEGEMYANGTEIMYDCPDGFDLNVNMTAVCRYGVWTYEDAYCTASPCNEPAPPDDLVFHSPDFADGEMYAHGTKIMYDCPDGLNLNGHMTAVCLYGEWTYEDANCTASPCDEPAPPDDLVFHSPDFAEGEMYANGTEIMYDCPDGMDLNGNMTAACLYGEWTYEDAYCTDSPCKDPAPANVGVIITPRSVEDDGKSGSRVSYSCPNGYILDGSRSAVCLYGRWIVETVPSCSAVCSKSTDCKSEQKSACDRKTRSCACPPGKTFQNGKCLVERIIRSSLQLEVAYKDDFANKSSCTFLLREQKIFTAFEEMFTRLDDKCNSWFVSCKVEAIRKLNVATILADVVTRYDEGVAMVTPEDFDTHIQSEAQSGLRLISITSEEESYNACEEGTDICDHENGYCIYHNGTNYECRCNNFTINRNQCNPAWHGIECDTCDKYTQCFYDEARMHSTVSCNIETANGNTAHPCYGDGSIITCSCKSDKFQLSSPDNSYLCRPDKWEDGLYDLNCSTGELTTDMSTIPIDTTTTTPASPCDEPDPPAYLVCHSPDFAKRERNANGTVIMNKCPDGFFFKDHRTAVCLYGKWTNEDANCIDWCKIILVIIIAIFTLLYAAQLIWLVKKHYLRRGTKWIPSVEGVANEQVPRTANDESKFVSKVDFEMSDPNGYQNDVNKEDNDACDHVGDNIRGDLPNNDPEEETV